MLAWWPLTRLLLLLLLLQRTEALHVFCGSPVWHTVVVQACDAIWAGKRASGRRLPCLVSTRVQAREARQAGHKFWMPRDGSCPFQS